MQPCETHLLTSFRNYLGLQALYDQDIPPHRLRAQA